MNPETLQIDQNPPLSPVQICLQHPVELKTEIYEGILSTMKSIKYI